MRRKADNHDDRDIVEIEKYWGTRERGSSFLSFPFLLPVYAGSSAHGVKNMVRITYKVMVFMGAVHLTKVTGHYDKLSVEYRHHYIFYPPQPPVFNFSNNITGESNIQVIEIKKME